jgi:hypothetical protein
MEQEQAVIFARREAKFRQHQQAELQALLKRIECRLTMSQRFLNPTSYFRFSIRRKEHIKQRNLDSKRLLQRNRNVQTVLESKQNFESQRLFDNIKKALQQNAITASNIANPGAASSSGLSPTGRGAKSRENTSAGRGGTAASADENNPATNNHNDGGGNYYNNYGGDVQGNQWPAESGYGYQQGNAEALYDDAPFLRQAGPSIDVNEG